MNTINHFVIIRFYCINNDNQEKLLSYNFLHEKLEIFKNYTLKSLENQSCKKFEIILLIHGGLDNNHPIIYELNNIKSSIKIHIIKFSQLSKFLSNYNNCKFLITTRIDPTDVVYKDAVFKTQSIINSSKKVLIWFAFQNGLTMINDNFDDVRLFTPKYKQIGSMSIWQNLIIQPQRITDLENVYDLGPHYNCLPKLIEFENKYNILDYEKDYIYDDIEKESWIYINHTNTSIKNFHKSNIILDENREFFIDRFGI